MPRRHPVQREKDLRELANRYLKGKTQAEIAVELGVSQQAISDDLKLLQKRWQAASLMDLDEAKARELAKIDELERVYWAEWLVSKQEKQVTQTAKKAGRAEAMVRKETRDGNPAYLAGVQWCIDRRCKLLGLDAPERTELTGKDGVPLFNVKEILVELPKEADDV